MAEYRFDSLADAPGQQYIYEHIASDMTNTNITDISYNPEKGWLKIWFEPELSSADESILSTIVTNSIGVKSQRTWRIVETDEDLCFQKLTGVDTWETKSRMRSTDPSI